MSYLLEYDEAPYLLKRKAVELRNDVVHKGKIPSREEAINFGNEVLSLVNPILRRLKETLPEAVATIIDRHMNKIRNDIIGDQKIQTISIPTIIHISRSNSETDETLEQALERLIKLRNCLEH